MKLYKIKKKKIVLEKKCHDELMNKFSESLNNGIMIKFDDVPGARKFKRGFYSSAIDILILFDLVKFVAPYDPLGLNIIDYVYLDDPNRKRFSKRSHKYLINNLFQQENFGRMWNSTRKK